MSRSSSYQQADRAFGSDHNDDFGCDPDDGDNALTPPSSNLWSSPAQFISSSFEGREGGLMSMVGRWDEEYHRQMMLRDAGGPSSGSNGDEDDPNSRWGVVSPMTRHMLLPTPVAIPTSPAHGARPRSFNDAFYAKQNENQSCLTSQLSSYDERYLISPTRRRATAPIVDMGDSVLGSERTLPEIPSLFGHKTQQSSDYRPNLNQHQKNDVPSTLTSLSTIDTAEKDTGSVRTYVENEGDDGSDEQRNSGQSSTQPQETKSVPICLLYGCLNATIVLPVLTSFCNIIYRDDFFKQYMPVLTKLTLVSGIVHQISFSTFSGLPFAIGQVQDAGLIFLSQMATTIVAKCEAQDLDDESILATVTVSLAIATAVLGVGLMCIGRCRLAGWVQMLPRPVIAAYLSFIGFYCGESGLLLMAGVSELTAHIFFENFLHILPGIAGGLVLYLAVRRIRHVAVLPVGIMTLILIFYIILKATGQTVEDATEHGWIRKSDRAPVWWRTWDYIRLDLVNWSVLKHLVVTEVAMIFVVAISSSLDIAAIELELNRPLDYDAELTTVGLSNVISGLTGGYTGSYIFSQTIFTMRSGIRSRLAGYVLAMCELFMVITPLPILSYVPNFFYGSLLSMICVDLCHEWLWEIRMKVTFAEYIICLSTFALIYAFGVPIGIVCGVGLFLICRKMGIDLGEPRSLPTDQEPLGAPEEETTHLMPKPRDAGTQF